MTERERQLAIDYKTFFASESGKRVFLDLVNMCNFNLVKCEPRKEKLGVPGIFMDKNGAIDPNKCMFHEGQRSVLLYIIKHKEIKL